MYQDNSEFHPFPGDLLAEECCPVVQQGTQPRGPREREPPSSPLLTNMVSFQTCAGHVAAAVPQLRRLQPTDPGACRWGTDRQPVKAKPLFALVFPTGMGRGPFDSDEGWRSGEGILKNCSVLNWIPSNFEHFCVLRKHQEHREAELRQATPVRDSGDCLRLRTEACCSGHPGAGGREASVQAWLAR